MVLDENELKLQLEINCQQDSISPLIQNLLKKMEKTDHGIKDLDFRLEVAAREMLANAIEHGCQEDEGKIEVKLTANSYEVTLRVKDPGSGFDWENADFSLPLLAEKGRGLGMIDKAADEIYFNERGNIIKVYFRDR
ncbi:MAG: ATP-binding protein [Bacillota bacterium]